MEGFLSPSGEISCPRLSFCMQHIRMKGELDRHTLLPPQYQSSKFKKKEKKRNFVAGCSVVAVIMIWKQYVVSTEPVVVVCFAIDLYVRIWSEFCPLSCAIHRGFCPFQRQSVRLQPTRPWSSYSGGPTSADDPTGKTHTHGTHLPLDHRSRSQTVGLTAHEVLFDAVTLPTSRGQCCKRCRRQPRGFRQATSTIYSLCTLTRR